MSIPVILMKPKMSSGELTIRLASIAAHLPVSLLPCELEHPLTASDWALACLKFNIGVLVQTNPYGGSEVGILDDQVWFTRYLIALARLTPEGRQTINAARGEHQETRS